MVHVRMYAPTLTTYTSAQLQTSTKVVAFKFSVYLTIMCVN